MKKICFDLQPLLKFKTGIGYYTENLVSELIKNKNNKYIGVDFSLLERNKKISLKGIEIKNFKILPYFYRKLTFLWRLIPFSINSLTGLDFDIYHCFSINIPHKTKAKVIITIHDLIPFLFYELSNNINKKNFFKYLKYNSQKATLIITVSEYSKKEIIKYLNVSKEKIKIISPGIDISKYSKNYFEDKEKIKIKYNLPEKFLLFLGALEPKKNISNIIKSFEKYKSSYKNNELKLIIAGGKGWKYKEIFEIYENSKIKNEIKFIGYVDEEDKIPLYKLAEIFIFPSLYEGFGMPVLEAMAAGIPVITSNVSSLPEVAGKGALLVDSHSIDEMAEGINKILSDENYKNKLIINGLEQCKKYTWEESARKLEKIYNSL